MPSILRTAAVAAFAVFASAQTFSNSTAPGPINFPGYIYDGCFSIQTGPGFLFEASSFMTVERCLLDCSNYRYSLIAGNDCFCAGSLNGTSKVAETSCAQRCPGNPTEACGGTALTAKRQAAGTIVSIYEKLAIVPAGQIYVTVITNVFIDYCPTCNNGGGALTTVTYLSTVTLTGCGCTTTPTIPTVVTTTVCPVNNSTTTLTLTVPTGVVPGQCTAATCTAPTTTATVCPTCPGGVKTVTVSPCPGCVSTTYVAPVPTTPVVTATKAVYTGGAVAVKAGSGLIAGAVAVAAFL